MTTPSGPAAVPPPPSAGSSEPVDPFWEVVRRRRPDLRLVLLPPEPPERPEPPGAWPGGLGSSGAPATVNREGLAALLQRTVGVLARVAADLLDEPGPVVARGPGLPGGPVDGPAMVLRPGPARGTRVAAGVLVRRGVTDPTLLDRLPTALPGWRHPPLQDRPGDPVRRRVTVEPGGDGPGAPGRPGSGCRVEATYRAVGGVLVLRVRSGAVRVAGPR